MTQLELRDQAVREELERRIRAGELTEHGLRDRPDPRDAKYRWSPPFLTPIYAGGRHVHRHLGAP